MSAPTSLRIAEFTWPDVRALLDAGWTTIILPLGATEQPGRRPMRPSLVRMAEARWGHIGEPAEALSEIGVIGDPRESTAELGGRYFEAMVAAMVSYCSSGAPPAAGAGRTA